MKFEAAFFLSLFLVVNISGQNEPEKSEPPQSPSDNFYSRGVGSPQPNVELPDHVPAENEKLTLFADYENADEEGVPLYLVNRTGKKQSFGTQDHDIYLKLEYQSKDGRWVRAQTQRNSWCGNSYYDVSLAPGQFFAFKGYHPNNGVAAKIRYHSDQHSLVSNVGSGFYLEVDRKAASLDDMAANEIPGPLGWMLRTGDSFPYQFEKSTAGYLAALEMLSLFSDSLYYRNEAQKMMENLGPESPEAKKIQEILAREWPNPAEGTEALVRLSLKNIRKGIQPALAWKLISESVAGGHGFSDPVPRGLLADIAQILPGSLQSENEQEVKMAAAIIDHSSFANEWISTEALLEWVKSKDAFVFGASAKALALRGKYPELIAIGLEEKEVARKVRILSFLVSAGKDERENFYPRRPESDEERLFWKDCLENHPVESVALLPGTYNDHNMYDRTVQRPLKKYLEEVVTQMRSEPKEDADLYRLSKLVRFFGTWNMEENAPVLEALLNHPGYTENEVLSSTDGRYLRRDFRIRRDAKAALLKMGISVNSGLILEERVPLAGQQLEK